MNNINYVTDAAIKSAYEALLTIKPARKVYADPTSDEYNPDNFMAWLRVKNFIDLVDQFKKENELEG